MCRFLKTSSGSQYFGTPPIFVQLLIRLFSSWCPIWGDFVRCCRTPPFPGFFPRRIGIVPFRSNPFPVLAIPPFFSGFPSRPTPRTFLLQGSDAHLLKSRADCQLQLTLPGFGVASACASSFLRRNSLSALCFAGPMRFPRTPLNPLL